MIGTAPLSQGIPDAESADSKIESCEIRYDGVSYALVPQGGIQWHLASLSQDWQSHLVAYGANPAPEALSSLQHEGIFLAQSGNATPLALMCQGMGALWPGVGRELYDTFPKAREAMDRIQSVASWDVLSLMDEDDMEKISATRWHIPYLFLIEYAQWSYLQSLGLKPTLMCGHSLGELIALCCSGIYTPELAWHILDTRAEHVSTLEAKVNKDCGMLAVHAAIGIVEDVLSRWPLVRVANYNTPRQFILGGSKDDLREIRTFLRKQRIPAVSINVSLLFHHPQMRVLREHSLMRLNMLDMHAPKTPVLSVSKICLYPNDQKEICNFIADLDENPVRFSECLQAMWNTYHIRSFLEIGPQDVLNGLICENLPDAQVLSCCRKNREAQALRELCARLFAEGRILYRDIERSRFIYHTSAVEQKSYVAFEESMKDRVRVRNALRKEASSDDAQKLLSLLASLTGQSNIELDWDIRGDLNLRSSSFPLLLKRASELFHHTPSFEDLLRVVTVGDLLHVFLGKALTQVSKSKQPRLQTLPSIVRVRFQNGRFLLHSFARSQKSVHYPRLGVAILGDLPKEWQRILFTDLFLGLPGLVESVVVRNSLAQFSDTLGGNLQFVCGDPFACECLLCIEHKSFGDEPSCNFHPKLGQRCILLRLWDSVPKKEMLARSILKEPFGTLDCICLPKRRLYHTLGMLFALELNEEKNSHTLWLEESLLPDFVASADVFLRAAALPKPPLCSECIPERYTPNLPLHTLRSRVYFSSLRDPCIRLLPNLPVSRALEVLAWTASQLSPWLRVVGFSDFEFASNPALYDSVVREGVSFATLVGWVSLYGVLTRQVQVRLSLEELGEQKRKTMHTTKYLSGAVILADQELPIPAYDMAFSSEDTVQRDLDPWYESRNVPKAWRLLSRICQKRADSLMIACKREGTCMPHTADRSYSFYLFLFECAVHAAHFFLEDADSSSAFSLSSAGFVLFSSCTKTDTWNVFLHCTLNEENLKRFDVKITNTSNQTLLFVSQLQFEPVQVPH